MSVSDESFVHELRVQFCRDSLDLLQSIEALLLEIERSGTKEKLDELKRLLHSLKGDARAVGFESISKAVHEMEGKCVAPLPPDLIDELLKRRDQFMTLLNNYLDTKDMGEILQFS